MYISAHFATLKNTINAMDLKDFVKFHQRVIDLANELNKLFSFIILEECLVLSLLISVMIVRILYSDDILKSVPIFFQVALCLINILIYCYGGQKITDSAGEICENCYEMDGNYMIILLRTKYELKIGSFIFNASLPTFTMIMNWTNALITFVESFL